MCKIASQLSTLVLYKTHTNCRAGFGQGYPQYLPLSFTSNSADTFLSQDFDHTHLLNTSTASTLSTGYSSVPIQQDQLLSAQSDSNSMNMSNSIQTDKDPMTFPVQSSVGKELSMKLLLHRIPFVCMCMHAACHSECMHCLMHTCTPTHSTIPIH